MTPDDRQRVELTDAQRKALKLLEALAEPCEPPTDDDHHWATCRHCYAIAELDDTVGRTMPAVLLALVRSLLAAAEAGERLREAAETDMCCEKHPELDWPHGDCAGPGCYVSMRVFLLVNDRRLLQQALRERDVIAGDAARAVLDGACYAEAGERIRAWANSETPKAHTYASENADLYRGWENGQNSAKQYVLALLPAEGATKEWFKANEQAWEDLRADGGLPEAQPAKGATKEGA